MGGSLRFCKLCFGFLFSFIENFPSRTSSQFISHIRVTCRATSGLQARQTHQPLNTSVFPFSYRSIYHVKQEKCLQCEFVCRGGHGTFYHCPTQTFIHTGEAETWVCKAKLQLKELLETTVFQDDTHKIWHRQCETGKREWIRVESTMVKPHLCNRLLSMLVSKVWQAGR